MSTTLPDDKKRDIGQGFGVGLGLIMCGTFILNVHYWFNNNAIFIQSLFGIPILVIGLLGMITEFSKKEKFEYINDIGISFILTSVIAIFFLSQSNGVVKIILAIIFAFLLIFLGMGIGNFILDESGNWRHAIKFGNVSKFLITLITAMAGILSTISVLADKSTSLIETIQKMLPK